MTINYSSNDTIDKYNQLFNEFKNIESEYMTLTKNRQLIDFSAGLALSNSIHERFIKSIVEDYIKLNKNSNIALDSDLKDNYIDSYKAPQRVKSFMNSLRLDPYEGFNFHKSNLPVHIPINSFYNLTTIIRNQRDIRNKYLHGDFNFTDLIVFEEFKKNLLDYQKCHVTVLRIVHHTFRSNIDKLPPNVS